MTVNPCENVCIIDRPSGPFQGCGRSLAEIEHRTRHGEAQRAEVMVQLPERLETIRARPAAG